MNECVYVYNEILTKKSAPLKRWEGLVGGRGVDLCGITVQPRSTGRLRAGRSSSVNPRGLPTSEAPVRRRAPLGIFLRHTIFFCSLPKIALFGPS